MADSVQLLSLYTGSGMLDEAVAAGLWLYGIGSRVLGCVERDAAAAALLLERMARAAVEPAPVFAAGLETLDARNLAGYVDILTASPPCQPYSVAGRQRGNKDHRSFGRARRGPLAHTLRIIRDCRPALVFLENVPEWVTGGHFRQFGAELSGLGYEIADPLFVSAADVGAPQERERVFILAHAAWCDWRSWSARIGMRAAGERLADAEGPRMRSGGSTARRRGRRDGDR